MKPSLGLMVQLGEPPWATDVGQMRVPWPPVIVTVMVKADWQTPARQRLPSEQSASETQLVLHAAAPHT